MLSLVRSDNLSDSGADLNCSDAMAAQRLDGCLGVSGKRTIAVAVARQVPYSTAAPPDPATRA